MSEIIELPEPTNIESTYEVWFAFKNDPSEEKFSQATTTVTTEKPISNLEELTEVSRAIGTANGYAELYIVTTFPPVENIDEILEHAKNSFGQMKSGKIVD